MARKIKIQTCQFIPVSSLVPNHWGEWFYAAISDQAPFSWGDNNKSLIDMERFATHCESVLEERVAPGAAREWLKKIRRIDADNVLRYAPASVYIDLEH